MLSQFSRITAVAVVLTIVGCGPNPQAKFSSRPEVQDLIPEAKTVAEDLVKKAFGTPQELVAWEELPLNFGGVKGKVLTPEEASRKNGSLNTLPVELAGKLTARKPGDPKPVLVWANGSQHQKPEVIRSVSVSGTGKEQQATLALASAQHEPAAGDEFIAGFGEQLQFGRQVYMKNCMHCHGVAGDGAGPTARYLNPRPRDYRMGIFKFTSTTKDDRASRADLTRIVSEGIPGTYMPSFLLLGERETTAVVEYVRFLAMRGEYEYQLAMQLKSDYGKSSLEAQAKKTDAKSRDLLSKAVSDFKEYSKSELDAEFKPVFEAMVGAWKHAEEEDAIAIPKASRVADSPESRARGRAIYLSDKGKCYTCHGPLGKGDGGATDDFWAKPGSEEKYPDRGLHDAWGNRLPPRNLTLGQYRGGRRPVDVYRRVYAGIKGTPMPNFATVFTPEEIWDVVNYVMSLPYESRKPVPSAHGDHH